MGRTVGQVIEKRSGPTGPGFVPLIAGKNQVGAISATHSGVEVYYSY